MLPRRTAKKCWEMEKGMGPMRERESSGKLDTHLSNPAEKSLRDFDYSALPFLTLLKHPGPSVPR